jgi:hypothetical protein
MEDPHGHVMGQESKGLEPKDFFDEDNFAAYKAFQIEMGIDPEVGFDEDCCEGNWCNEAPFSPSGSEPTDVEGKDDEERETDAPSPSGSGRDNRFSANSAMGIIGFLVVSFLI